MWTADPWLLLNVSCFDLHQEIKLFGLSYPRPSNQLERRKVRLRPRGWALFRLKLNCNSMSLATSWSEHLNSKSQDRDWRAKIIVANSIMLCSGRSSEDFHWWSAGYLCYQISRNGMGKSSYPRGVARGSTTLDSQLSLVHMGSWQKEIMKIWDWAELKLVEEGDAVRCWRKAYQGSTLFQNLTNEPRSLSWDLMFPPRKHSYLVYRINTLPEHRKCA